MSPFTDLLPASLLQELFLSGEAHWAAFVALGEMEPL